QVEAMTMGQRIAVMSNGVLQQVDEPETVYNKPANKFVAGFVGAPPMNFIDGKIEGGHFVSASMKFGLKSGHAALGHEGKKVTLGIRPEDIYDASAKNPVPVTDENTFEAQVDVLEKLGAEDTAYLVAGDFHITATLDPASRIESGVTAKFAVDLDKIHIFDGETEVAIR
ncbi:MAG: ABC transporter ATP-binding protein, partial [Armatimonadetes bacterium]|nr:ABC transporter ATP-binding protein [Armatimonadota bacterium]